VSGFPANDDVIAKNETDWNVDPLMYPSKIVTDSPHVVRSTRSLPQRMALTSFSDVIASHLHSHNLFMAHPASVVTDSGERVIVSDPAARAIHVFDLKADRYFRIQGGADRRRLQMPWGVAVDSSHNIYVTDVELGMILVYGRDGRFLRYLGKRSDGEGGFFDRPTGIAIDRKNDRIYLLDTTRHMILVLDPNGRILNRIGRPDLD
jgi:DNA-binding beta-propeller fold protein YncE